MNGGTSEVAEAVLIEAGTWARIEGDADRAGPLVWGCDLGTSAAMSAIAAYWPDTGRLETVAAFPVDPPLAERGLRDGVGSLYVETKTRDELIQTGQRAVDLDGLLIEALTRFGRPNVIAADRWREPELRDALDRAGVPPAALEIRGMGWRDGAEDVRGFRRAILEGKVTPKPTKLLRYAWPRRACSWTLPATPSSPSGPRAGAARRRETMRRLLRSWPLRRRSTRHSTAAPSAPSCACRMSKRHLPLFRTRRWKVLRLAVLGRGQLDVRGVRALRQRSGPPAPPATRREGVGPGQPSSALPRLPYRENAPRERPRARAARRGVAGARVRSD